jgi:hypothetical protein
MFLVMIICISDGIDYRLQLQGVVTCLEAHSSVNILLSDLLYHCHIKVTFPPPNKRFQ